MSLSISARSPAVRAPLSRMGAVEASIPLPCNIITRAHKDDVHGLLALDAEKFVSGSKDTTLRIWDTVKKSFQEFYTHPLSEGYKSWVTCLGSIGENWAAGSRDGHIVIRKRDGEIIKQLDYDPGVFAKGAYVCKDRNKNRINCIEPVLSKENLFYTGTPSFIQLWNLELGEIVSHYKASDNDWVYCIKPLNENLLVAVGSYVEHWDMSEAMPKRSPVISPKKGVSHSPHKPHISSLEKVASDENYMMATLFDGSVRLIDLWSQSVARLYQEHEGRVWTVINIAPHVMASGADDKTIKLWDIRQASSILTLSGQSGRVSALLSLNPETLISASCPDDVFKSIDKCSLSFWDTRKLTISTSEF